MIEKTNREADLPPHGPTQAAKVDRLTVLRQAAVAHEILEDLMWGLRIETRHSQALPLGGAHPLEAREDRIKVSMAKVAANVAEAPALLVAYEREACSLADASRRLSAAGATFRRTVPLGPNSSSLAVSWPRFKNSAAVCGSYSHSS